MRSSRNQRLATAALWASVAVIGLSAAGCNSVGRALGGSKVTPDEFRVVTKAPLVVPPDYALRPPSPGEPRPQELQPESAARVALVGEREAAARSQGESLLANRAGAERADPLIRYVVDDEFGDVAHKDQAYAEQVLASTGAATPAAPAAGDGAAALNPAPATPNPLTGGLTVTITRGSGGVKLPGL